MPLREHLDLLWLGGPNCDGCTIEALGETAVEGIEALPAGRVPGLPRVRLTHPTPSPETGAARAKRCRQAERGKPDPFGLVVKASIPNQALAGSGFFSSLGGEGGRPVPIPEWLDRQLRAYTGTWRGAFTAARSG